MWNHITLSRHLFVIDTLLVLIRYWIWLYSIPPQRLLHEITCDYTLRIIFSKPSSIIESCFDSLYSKEFLFKNFCELFSSQKRLYFSNSPLININNLYLELHSEFWLADNIICTKIDICVCDWFFSMCVYVFILIILSITLAFTGNGLL